MLPQAVGHHLSGHGVFRTGNPLGEHAAFAGGLVAVPVAFGNIRFRGAENLRERRTDFFALQLGISAR